MDFDLSMKDYSTDFTTKVPVNTTFILREAKTRPDTLRIVPAREDNAALSGAV